MKQKNPKDNESGKGQNGKRTLLEMEHLKNDVSGKEKSERGQL